MTLATTALNKYDRAEAFLKTCTNEELSMTLSVLFGFEPKIKKTSLVSVPLTKSELAEALIRDEEATRAKERGDSFFILSQWGRDSYARMSLVELKVRARYRGVSITKKVYRDRVTTMTKQEMIDYLLYETDYADAW